MLQGLEEEPETGTSLRVANPKETENPSLQLLVVDPDTPPPDLTPVEHEIVGARARPLDPTPRCRRRTDEGP